MGGAYGLVVLQSFQNVLDTIEKELDVGMGELRHHSLLGGLGGGRCEKDVLGIL